MAYVPMRQTLKRWLGIDRVYNFSIETLFQSSNEQCKYNANFRRQIKELERRVKELEQSNVQILPR